MAEPESEEQIIRYLLGDSSEDEISALESHILREPAFFDSVAAVEDSLIMKYVCGNLQARWLPLFENVYLTSDARRARVESARVLREAVSDANAWHKVRWTTLKSSLRSLRPVILAPALAILVLTFGWIVWKGASLTQSGRPIMGSQIAFRMKPGLRRSSQEGSSSTPQQFALAGRIHEIRFDLEIVALPQYKSYRALVGTPERPATWSGAATVQGDILSATVPADVLPIGDYTLQLQGVTSTGNAEPIDIYYFRLTK